MRVFLTGATGFVGSAIIPELLTAGHQVLGLTRSDKGAGALKAAGAEPHHGTLEDLDSLRRGAETTDGTIHCAFIHDFSRYEENIKTDGRAIEALTGALAGSGKPFVTTFGVGLLAPGRTATEDEAPAPGTNPRSALEAAVLAAAGRGVRASILRLPPSVHGDGDHGFVPILINLARQKGVSAYVSDGSNRWPAVHRLDAARLYRLALEKAPAGARLLAIADEGVPTRDIAGVIGRRLNLPVVSIPAEQVDDHFGFLGRFFAFDIPASSALTQERLGWHPAQPGLLADLAQEHYFAS